MPLQVHQVALETITALRPLMPRIRRHDRSLTVQLKRTASSAVLNIGEVCLPKTPSTSGRLRLVQYRRNPTRYHLTTVAGFTMISASLQLLHRRDSSTRRPRSTLLSRGRFWVRA